MNYYYNILSFEKDDTQEKLIESAIKVDCKRFKLRRVTNWRDYAAELKKESYDCILCDEDNLKDSEKKNTIKYAKEVSPFTTFISLSSTFKKDIKDKVTKKYRQLHHLSKADLGKVASKIIESKSNSFEDFSMSNYWG